MKSLNDVRKTNSAVRLEVYHMLSSLLLSEINQSNIKFSIETEHVNDRLSRFVAEEPWEYYAVFFRNSLSVLFEHKSSEQKRTTNKAVLEIQDYIDNNLCGDLSLTRIGNHVNLNPSYLSRLFKQMMDKNLTDYITEIRIKKAKELLHKTMKIQDIAEAVGYYSGTSFARVFKMRVNMTPQEYRDKLF